MISSPGAIDQALVASMAGAETRRCISSSAGGARHDPRLRRRGPTGAGAGNGSRGLRRRQTARWHGPDTGGHGGRGNPAPGALRSEALPPDAELMVDNHRPLAAADAIRQIGPSTTWGCCSREPGPLTIRTQLGLLRAAGLSRPGRRRALASRWGFRDLVIPARGRDPADICTAAASPSCAACRPGRDLRSPWPAQSKGPVSTAPPSVCATIPIPDLEHAHANVYDAVQMEPCGS